MLEKSTDTLGSNDINNRALVEILNMIKDLTSRRVYGKVEITLRAGKIVHTSKQEGSRFD